MQLIDDLPSNREGVEPDQKAFIMDIAKVVADYYFHSDYNFVVTANVNYPLQNGKNIVFLTGNETNRPFVNLPKAHLMFSGFFKKESEGKVHCLPIGVPKHFNNIPQFNLRPIKDRQLNMFYCGCNHKNRREFFEAFQNVAQEVPNCAFKATPKNNPQKDLIDKNPDAYIGFSAYWAALCETKVHPICINVTTPHDNYRYFESLYAGTINVMAEKEIRQGIWFYDHPLNVFIDSWKDMNGTFIQNTIDRYKDFDVNEAIRNYREKFSKHSLAAHVIDIIDQNE